MPQIFMSGLNFDFWGDGCVRIFDTAGFEKDGERKIWMKGKESENFPTSEIVFLVQLIIEAVIKAGSQNVHTVIVNERAAIALYLLKKPFPVGFDCVNLVYYKGITALEITRVDLWLTTVNLVVIPAKEIWISDVAVAVCGGQTWENVLEGMGG